MFLRLTSTAVLAAFVACGDEAAETTSAVAPPAVESAAPAPAAGAPSAEADDAEGGITGKVTFRGTVPEATPNDLSADKICEHHDQAPKETQSVVVGAGDGLADVFVYVSDDSVPDGKYKAPDEPVLLDQIGCHYTPHVFGVMARQEILIRNSDDTLHNIHAMPDDNKEFNVGMPIKGQEIKKDFRKAEKAIKIKCDVHPWMLAWCFTMDHPFYGVSGADGTFAIAGLPDGEYGVTAWHETLGEKTGRVTVTDGAGTLDFEFSN